MVAPKSRCEVRFLKDCYAPTAYMCIETDYSYYRTLAVSARAGTGKMKWEKRRGMPALLTGKGWWMKTAKKLWGTSCFDRYLLGMFIAVELLMSFTFLGYIHIPPISVTIAYIPILVAGCLLGPAQSVIVGLVFGIASMYKASASYVMPSDAAFSPFLSGSPVYSLLLSVGTRALFGLVIGLAYLAVKKRKHDRLWTGLITITAPKVHSLIVYTVMGILFPELGYRFSSALHWDWRDTLFAFICVVTVEALWAVYRSGRVQNVRMYIDQAGKNPYAVGRMTLFFALFELFLLFMATFAADYFSQRESFMLEQHGITVSDQISVDLLHLQIQFLVALLSLNVISLILLLAIYKYMSYREYRGEIDALTGVMGRRMFLFHCEKVQKAGGAGQDKKGLRRPGTNKTGWFMFVDVDYFKSINDSFGHSAGDKVLREIASNLQSTFEEEGEVGRIGGDEFAVIVESPLSQQALEQKLDQFLASIAGILPDKKVSCSIGAYEFAFPQNVKKLLAETDEMLYKAKENGRACYVIKACTRQS